MLVGYMRVSSESDRQTTDFDLADWEHVNPYGRFDLEMNSRLALL
jgi:hypothetical protein